MCASVHFLNVQFMVWLRVLNNLTFELYRHRAHGWKRGFSGGNGTSCKFQLLLQAFIAFLIFSLEMCLRATLVITEEDYFSASMTQPRIFDSREDRKMPDNALGIFHEV